MKNANPSRHAVASVFFLGGVVLLFLETPIGWLLIAAAILIVISSPHGTPGTHGTARLAHWKDARQGGLISKSGLILGRTDLLGRNKPVRAPSLLRLGKFTHLGTFAPTGKGKGVSVILPNLLTYPGSVVITDPKRENWRITAAYRERAFGQRAYRLDVGLDGGDSLNPLDYIDDRAEDFIDRCRTLAGSLVVRKGTEAEPHWNDMAELIITSLVAFVCACESDPDERNLLTVRRLLSSKQRFFEAIAIMQQAESHHGLLAELAGMMLWPGEKELGSVLSTVQRHTQFLDSPAVARCVSRSSFDPRCLRNPKGASLYLCMPHDQLETYAPLTRLWVSTLLKVLTRGEPGEAHPVLFLLDEVANLGKLPALEESVVLHRGMGIRLWLFFQSIHQVQECYGEKAQSILENLETHQFFATKSTETAAEISRRIGDTTLVIEKVQHSYGSSKSPGGDGQPSSSRNVSISREELGRQLLKPEEILTLPPDMALIFHGHLPPVAASLIRYYDAPELARHRRLLAKVTPTATKERPRRNKVVSALQMLTGALMAAMAIAVLVKEATSPRPADEPASSTLELPPPSAEPIQLPTSPIAPAMPGVLKPPGNIDLQTPPLTPTRAGTVASAAPASCLCRLA